MPRSSARVSTLSLRRRQCRWISRSGQRVITMVAKYGELLPIVGTVDGRAIVNLVLRVVLDRIDFAVAPQDAVKAGRVR